MKKVMDRETILKQYESEFIDWLEKCCQVYKVMGMSRRESPMWIQYKGENLFASSQGSEKNDYLNIYCNLELKEEHKEYFSFNQYNEEEIYDHFRDLKYNYIEKNHPTIYSEIR